MMMMINWTNELYAVTDGPLDLPESVANFSTLLVEGLQVEVFVQQSLGLR
jgi:hypothetical protein